MNHTYNVDVLNNKSNFIAMTTTATSLQTDPDLYALKKQQQQQQVVSTNRSAYVEALVDINAVVIESIWYNTPTTSTTRVSPVVPLRTFIQEVLKRSRTTYSTLQTALFYLFRARPSIIDYQQNNAYISCGRRMFLASLVIASKFVQDKTYRNSAWAKIAGLPVSEINTAERYFLKLLDYRLYIDQSIFDNWHRLLHTVVTILLPIDIYLFLLQSVVQPFIDMPEHIVKWNVNKRRKFNTPANPGRNKKQRFTTREK